MAVRVATDEIIVEKSGLRVRVTPPDVRANSRVRKGTSVEVRSGNELRGASPGFYVALGDRALASDADAVRLYWNLSPEGAIRFVANATRLLNGGALPFGLKVLTDPSLYLRHDSVVLYVARADFGGSTMPRPESSSSRARRPTLVRNARWNGMFRPSFSNSSCSSRNQPPRARLARRRSKCLRSSDSPNVSRCSRPVLCPFRPRSDFST